jgi:methyl-accepting chemotaxis protein
VAATTIRDLLVRLGVRADTVQVKRFDEGLKAARRTMFAAAGAAVALTTALFASTVATARQGDEAAKMAERVGVSAEEMQELGSAAKVSGATIQDVETLLRAQARTAREAARGTGEMAEIYQKLAGGATDATGAQKDQLTLLLQLSDGLAGIENDGERAALAMRLFEEGGPRLLPLLRQGSAGINALRMRARELGAVLDEETTQAAEDFTDRMTELRLVVTGVRNRIGAALIPVLTQAAERVTDWFIANRRVINQRVDRVVEGITRAVDFMEEAWRRVDKAVREGPGGWDVIFEQVKKVFAAAGIAGILRGIAVAVGTVNAAMALLAANPVTLALGLLAAAVIAAALVIEDFAVFVRGGDSAIGALLESFDRAEPFLMRFNRLVAAGADLLRALAEVVVGPVVRAIDAVLPGFLTWENILKVLDVLVLSFILNIEAGMERAAGRIEFVTTALRDMRGFLALVTGLASDLANAVDRAAGAFTRFDAATPNLAGPFVGAAAAGAGEALTSTAVRGIGARAGLLGRAFGAISERFGPRQALPTGPQTTTITQEGDTITIPSVISPAELEAFFIRRDQAKLLQAMSAARGGDR